MTTCTNIQTAKQRVAGWKLRVSETADAHREAKRMLKLWQANLKLAQSKKP